MTTIIKESPVKNPLVWALNSCIGTLDWIMEYMPEPSQKVKVIVKELIEAINNRLDIIEN